MCFCWQTLMPPLKNVALSSCPCRPWQKLLLRHIVHWQQWTPSPISSQDDQTFPWFLIFHPKFAMTFRKETEAVRNQLWRTGEDLSYDAEYFFSVDKLIFRWRKKKKVSVGICDFANNSHAWCLLLVWLRVKAVLWVPPLRSRELSYHWATFFFFPQLCRYNGNPAQCLNVISPALCFKTVNFTCATFLS